MMEKGAYLSVDKWYRYSLWRLWDSALRRCVFVGLNPSTADGTKDDPTTRKWYQYANLWGYGGYYAVNLYGYRSSSPQNMFARAENFDIVGPDNDRVIGNVIQAASVDKVIVCWGMYGAVGERARILFDLLVNAGKTPYCLGVNSNGTPKHPLWLPLATQLKEYKHA
jgi:hypothetical protein